MKPTSLFFYTLAACTFGAFAAPQDNGHAVGAFLERRSKKAVETKEKSKTHTSAKAKSSGKTSKTEKSSKASAKSSGKDSKSKKSTKAAASSKVKVAPTSGKCVQHSIPFGKGTRVVPYYNYKKSSSGSVDIVDLSGGKKNAYYALGSHGLEMKLLKPTKGNKLGRGMTFNTTFEFEYGTVSFDMKAAGVPGTVTAGIILATGGDEVDIEITGKDKNAYESNIYLGGHPVFGVFGKKDAIKSSTTDWHTYSIKRTPSYIEWSVDGKVSRTLKNGPDSMYKGKNHYPYHAGYLQFGIWDASYPAGTASWAGGPIKWKNIKGGEISAYLRNLKVTC